HVLREVRVVSHLDDDVVENLQPTVIVPNHDGVNVRGRAEIDLSVLRTLVHFDDLVVKGLFLAVGDLLRFAGDRVLVAQGDLLMQGDVDGASGRKKWRPRFIGKGFNTRTGREVVRRALQGRLR